MVVFERKIQSIIGVIEKLKKGGDIKIIHAFISEKFDFVSINNWSFYQIFII